MWGVVHLCLGHPGGTVVVQLKYYMKYNDSAIFRGPSVRLAFH